MNLQFVQTFHFVAQLGSMAEAARHLEISPAAVVHQLRALEKDLGVKLTARSGRRVAPTAAGHRLLDGTRSVLQQVAEARASVHGNAMVGELRLGTINTALHSLLPDFLSRYASEYPDVRLRVHADISPNLFQQLQDDAIDLAICQHPPFDLPKVFRWVWLKDEPLVVLAHEDFAQELAEQVLTDQSFIRYDRKLAGGRQADIYLRSKGIVVRERCELDSLLAIALMIHQKQGVSLVPRFESLLTSALAITQLQLPEAPVARCFGILWKAASPKAALITAFSEYATSVHD